MIMALFLIGFAAAATAIGLVCATKVTVGYEDDNGFHYGRPQCLGSDAAQTLFVTASQNLPQPHDDAVIPPNIIKISWARPALGMAALFIMLFTLLPAKFENKNPLMFSQNLVLTKAESALPENPSATISLEESSRFAQKLCQRFDRIE